MGPARRQVAPVSCLPGASGPSGGHSCIQPILPKHLAGQEPGLQGEPDPQVLVAHRDRGTHASFTPTKHAKTGEQSTSPSVIRETSWRRRLVGVPSASTLGCAGCLVASSQDSAWLPASQRGRLHAELGEERVFLEDPALGLAPGLLGFSRVEDGDLAHSSAHTDLRGSRRPSLWEGAGWGGALCLGSVTWGEQWGSGGPLAGCSRAPSRQAPPSSGCLWSSPLPAKRHPWGRGSLARRSC